MTKKQLEKALAQIAQQQFVALEDRADLEEHGNDDEDFINAAVWEIKAAMLAAYELGRKEAAK